MSKTRKDGHKAYKGGGRQRHISVRAVRRDPPDLRKLSRALIALAMEQAAAEAAAQDQAHNQDRDQQQGEAGRAVSDDTTPEAPDA